MTRDPRLLNLFVEGLRRLHAAHHQGAEQARQNIETSSLPKLKQMLRAGSELNLVQAGRLEPILRSLGRGIESRTDQAMTGIAGSNKALVAKADGRATRDLANIESGQIAAHFYLATYGTLRSYAKTLGLRDAAVTLGLTLAETRKVDVAFSVLASRILAKAGNSSYPAESALYTTAALHPVRTAVAGFALVAVGAATALSMLPPSSPHRDARRSRSR